MITMIIIMFMLAQARDSGPVLRYRHGRSEPNSGSPDGRFSKVQSGEMGPADSSSTRHGFREERQEAIKLRLKTHTYLPQAISNITFQMRMLSLRS